MADVGWHLPSFSITFALLAMPAVIALVAENIGHVKAVSGMTGVDLDPVMGRAVAADGVATVIATSVGGSPTTTYAENIGVMAATRVYSTAAYYVAAVVAILLGLVPKFGAIVNATPRGRARRDHAGALRDDRSAGRQDLDREQRQLRQPGQPGADLRRADHRDRLRHRPASSRSPTTSPSAASRAGTIVIVAGYHLARVVAPRGAEGTMMAVGATGAHANDESEPGKRAKE